MITEAFLHEINLKVNVIEPTISLLMSEILIAAGVTGLNLINGLQKSCSPFMSEMICFCFKF